MRTVVVDPPRLERWLTGFAGRHGSVSAEVTAETIVLTAPDGAEARVSVPFPPLVGDSLPDLIAQATRERTVGALLIRRGGVAVGVFEGRRLVASKIQTSYVQGKTKAGGWSQQRYARRRDNQARKLSDAAADLMVGIVLPRLEDLAAVATGGDRAAVDAVLADRRLQDLIPLLLPRTYPVPDPRLAVLQDFPTLFLGVEIALNDRA